MSDIMAYYSYEQVPVILRGSLHVTVAGVGLEFGAEMARIDNVISALPRQDANSLTTHVSSRRIEPLGLRGFLLKYRDNLAEAYLMLLHLIRSRIITSPTRRSAENLATMLEEELAQTQAPEKSDNAA